MAERWYLNGEKFTDWCCLLVTSTTTTTTTEEDEDEEEEEEEGWRKKEGKKILCQICCCQNEPKKSRKRGEYWASIVVKYLLQTTLWKQKPQSLVIVTKMKKNLSVEQSFVKLNIFSIAAAAAAATYAVIVKHGKFCGNIYLIIAIKKKKKRI